MAFDLAQFKRNLVFETQAPPDAVLEQLASIREVDRENEGIAKILQRSGCGVLLLGVGGLVAGAVTESVAVLATAGAVVAVAIVVFVVRRRFARLDTEDRRYLLVDSTVRLLAADMDPEQEIALALDLGKPKQKRKLVSEGEIGHWKVEFYEDPWLEMTTRLLDGTTCRVQVTEHFQYRHRWARSSSGKRKHKSKTKSATRFLVRLKVRERRYPGLARLADSAGEAVQLPAAVQLKALAVEPPSLAIQTAIKHDWGIAAADRPLDPTVIEGTDIVAMMFLSLYQVLNLARRLEATA